MYWDTSPISLDGPKNHETFLYRVKQGMLIDSPTFVLLFVLQSRTPVLVHMAMGLTKGLSFLIATGGQLVGNRSGWVEVLIKCFNLGTDSVM